MKFLLTLMLLLCVTLTTGFAADTAPSVVVKVNGAPLTQAELDQEIGKIMPMERSFHGAVSEEKQREVRKKALDVLIDMELQYQDGLAKGHKLDRKALDREIDLLAAKFPVREAYQEAINNAGFNETTIERFLSRNVISKKMKEVEVDNKVNVTDAMVSSYYKENRSRYMKPEEYRASLILIKVPPSSLPEQREEFRKKAEDIASQLQKGAEFSQLAAKYSDDMSRIKGGDLGYFHSGQSDDPEFDKAVTTLKIGEVSKVIASLKGFYIVKLTERKPPRELPFEEVKEKIKTSLVSSEKTRLFSEWMASLKARATIEYPSQSPADKGSNR